MIIRKPQTPHDKEFALAHAFGKNSAAKMVFSRTSWPDHEERVAHRQDAAQHVLQADYAHGNAGEIGTKHHRTILSTFLGGL